MSYLLNVYNRLPINLIKGEGVYLYDDHGNKYLDFAAGISTVSLGHCHPYIIEALNQQSQLLWHCSNLFSIPEQHRLAERLVQLTFADKVFFCSSGLEATEAAIKMMRRYHYVNGNANRNTIITIEGGFHGRSMAAISAGGNDLAREGYAPLLPGFRKVSRNDIAELENTIDENTAAVFLEPIQSEGGIYPLDIDYLKAIREITSKHNLLLAFDEVQTGYGRTSSLFYYQQLGFAPDILTCAKAMGNGFPLAACLTSESVASVMKPSTHGSTYGGNPLAMAVGNAVLDVITQPQFLHEVKNVAKYLQEKLHALQKKFPEIIKEVRGIGLLIGIELNANYSVKEVIRLSVEKGLLLTKTAQPQTIRIVPPLIITQSHVDECIDILSCILMGAI